MHRHEYEEQREASLSGRKLRTPEAARRIGVSPSTMNKWRIYGRGPPYSKLGSIVVYDDADLEDFVRANRRTSTSEEVA